LFANPDPARKGFKGERGLAQMVAQQLNDPADAHNPNLGFIF
jgi:hypothetical protein